ITGSDPSKRCRVSQTERPVDPTRSTGRSCNRHPLPTDAPEVTLAMTNLALAPGGTVPPSNGVRQSWFATGTSATLLTTRSTGPEPAGIPFIIGAIVGQRIRRRPFTFDGDN